ncbi:hypothetical protein ACI780_10805 [Geodermatophilus sp. SYSU D00814]
MRPPAPATWLAAALGGSGVLHLLRPRTYEWLVPPELGDARAWVLASGVAERAAAALLTAPPTRRVGGWVAAALLTSFVPAHLHHLRVARGRPALLAAGLVRLPLQVPLVGAALRVARGR